MKTYVTKGCIYVAKQGLSYFIAFIAFGFCFVLLQEMGVGKFFAGGLGCVVGYVVFQFFTKILNKVTVHSPLKIMRVKRLTL